MSTTNQVVELVAQYGVVTPLFCAGAEPTEAEVRLPSFKGMLRFWWRALAWSLYNGELAKIHKAENNVFGSGGAAASRSRVVMRLANVSMRASVKKDTVLEYAGKPTRGNNVVGEGARYLGYGLMEAFDRWDKKKSEQRKAGQLQRACLVQSASRPFQFDVRMRCRGLTVDELDLLTRSLEILGTVGGMGARNRRGYGSLMLTSLTQDGTSTYPAPATAAELRERLTTLLSSTRRGPVGLPEYTAFSADSRHVVLSAADTHPLQLLDLVGREMLRYRSFGRDGKILSDTVPSEQNFKQDHDSMFAVARGPRTPASHPERIAFGLPHNYYFSSAGRVNVGPGDGQDRRASPLFIHIHYCGRTPVAVLSFLPAVFLPLAKHGARTTVISGRKVPLRSEADGLYQPIHKFLNRFVEGNHKEKFSEVLEVFA